MPTTLLLVPTPLERELLSPALAPALGDSVRLELCGFGPVAAAARTAELVTGLAPQRVLLVGIAGRFRNRLAVGAAYRFQEVACHGVGVGGGAGVPPAAELGWHQWTGEPAGADGRPTAGAAVAPIGDRLPCPWSRGQGPASAGLLLSACAASAAADDVSQRIRLYPEAEAEDMEGFGVALACRLRGVPVGIVRGISNDAGDRDRSRWRIAAALAAAADLAIQVLAEES
jgi:futalosine hydrolase